MNHIHDFSINFNIMMSIKYKLTRIIEGESIMKWCATSVQLMHHQFKPDKT